MKLFILLLAALSVLSTVRGYRILGIFPIPSRSHSILAKGVVDALLRAGHEVTWVTPFTDWKPVKNLTIIGVDTQSLMAGIDMTDPKNGLGFVKTFARNFTTMTYQTPAVQDLLVKQQFDAVVTEWFFSDTDAGYAAVQQVPWILLNGMLVHPHMEYLMDEVRSISTIPLMMNNFPIPMNFWQRLTNTIVYVISQVSMWLDIPPCEAIYEKNFAPLAAARGVPLTPFLRARENISILLVNAHSSFAPAQSLPPNMVDIAGYHIDEAAPLPTDLQVLLDSSPQGVVYFSMGSVIKSTQMPQHTREAVIQMLGALPYPVLWKFEQQLEGVPTNVHIRPWWPQTSILAHPNVKLFITHGGLLSSLEALHYGVPLLAVPVFGDQHSNADRAVKSGYALKVLYSPDMGPQLKVALNQLLKDESYYKQAKYLSKLFNKRPVAPSKLVSYYIELAIETKGAYHLRSKAYDYPWYQRWMLDQIAAVLLVLYILCKVVKIIIRTFRHKDKEERNEKRQARKEKKN